MKKIIFTIFFLSLYLQVYSQGLNSVTSPDGQFVIAAGKNGVVYRSTNSGSTWEKFSVSNINFNSVSSFSSKYWIAGENGSVYIGDVSVPGSLNRVIVNENISLNSIFFLSESVGWVAGDDGFVYQSTNGGYTWNLSNTGIANVNINCIHLNIDGFNAAVVGDNGIFYYSFDGGANWISENTNTDKTLLSVVHLGTDIFIAGEYGVLFRKPQFAPIQSIDSKTWWDINTVHGVEPTSVKIGGGGGFIRNNDAPGFNNFEKNPMIGEISSIYMVNDNIGYAVSKKNDAIMKTTNNGSSWSFMNVGNTSFSWSTVLQASGSSGNGFWTHPNDRNVLFIAQGSGVYRSQNLGETWTQVATISEGSGGARGFFINENDTNMWIAAMGTSNGRIVRTTNYGQTWSTVWGPGNLTTFGNALQMDVNNNNHVYLAPDNSVLLRSTNFGTNWTTASTHVFASPCEVQVKWGDSDVIYVGDNAPGRFYRTTNGGVNWDLTNTMSTSEVPMIGISKFDPELVFHTFWSAGGTWRSTNSGVSFVQTSTVGSAWGCAVSLDDPTVFTFVTYGGAAYVTLNQGESYSNVTNIGSSNASAQIANRETFLVQGTAGIYKLRTNYTINATNVVVTDLGENITSTLPDVFALGQNYPNPFNPETKISFDIPKLDFVTLKVFDQVGREVATLVNDIKNPGRYEVSFNGRDYSSGVYFYRLQTSVSTLTKRMILVK